MSIILKPSALKVKDDNGNYIGTNMFAAESTQEYLDAIETIGTQTQTAISTASTQAQATMEAKAEQTIESIPEDYTELAGDVTTIKADLADTNDFLGFEKEEYVPINGYDNNNASTSISSNSPFVFINQTIAPDADIVGIKILVAQIGTLSIGTIKKTDAIYDNVCDITKISIKDTLSINNTGEQYILLNNKFKVSIDEYLFICTPNNTCSIKYGANGIDKRFRYVSSITGKWTDSTNSLGINVYGQRVYKPDKTYNELCNDVTELNSIINKTSVIPFDAYNENNQTNGSFRNSPFIVTKNIPYNYFLTGIKINVRVAGTITIGKIKKTDVVIGQAFDASKITIHETLEINEIGLQDIMLKNIMPVNMDEYVTYGLPSNTAGFYYGSNGTDRVFYYVINNMYNTSGNSLNIVLYGTKVDNEQETSIYSGKTISILGDSISTFNGYIPDGNATYYPSGTVTQVTDTWWKKLIDALGMTLNVNNSWSGSRVTTTGGETSAGCMTRCESLGETPDVIIVWMGINDFNNEVALGTYDGKSVIPETTTTFREAYGIMLNKILTTYPYSEVWVCTLPQCERNGDSGFPEINGNNVALADFNEAILELARAFGVKVLDHNKCGLTYQNMPTFNPNNLHPNKYGHSLVANNDIWQMDNMVRIRYPISN